MEDGREMKPGACQAQMVRCRFTVQECVGAARCDEAGECIDCHAGNSRSIEPWPIRLVAVW